jgi:hypothetical protein
MRRGFLSMLVMLITVISCTAQNVYVFACFKNLRLAYGDELTGPYSQAGTPITGNYWAEGPTVLQLGKDWLIYFDRYMDHHYGAILSSDRQLWTDVSDKISLPQGIRHGTIFTVSDKELQALL